MAPNDSNEGDSVNQNPLDKLRPITKETSPWFGTLSYASSEGLVPAKVRIFVRESDASESRLKYVFTTLAATKSGKKLYAPVDHEHRIELN
jgi:hypothetical protein